MLIKTSKRAKRVKPEFSTFFKVALSLSTDFSLSSIPESLKIALKEMGKLSTLIFDSKDKNLLIVSKEVMIDYFL